MNTGEIPKHRRSRANQMDGLEQFHMIFDIY